MFGMDLSKNCSIQGSRSQLIVQVYDFNIVAFEEIHLFIGKCVGGHKLNSISIKSNVGVTHN